VALQVALGRQENHLKGFGPAFGRSEKENREAQNSAPCDGVDFKARARKACRQHSTREYMSGAKGTGLMVCPPAWTFACKCPSSGARKHLQPSAINTTN